jgi:hypothetical protein
MSLSTDIPRQPRITRPTAKLVDINNGEKAPLAFQRAAVAAAVTARLEAHDAVPSLPPSSGGESSPSTLTQQVSESFNDVDEDGTDQESVLPITGGSKRQIIVSSDDESSVESSKKKKQKSKGM